jgi:hypothetical protein
MVPSPALQPQRWGFSFATESTEITEVPAACRRDCSLTKGCRQTVSGVSAKHASEVI